jgi:hypothetical protein
MDTLFVSDFERQQRQKYGMYLQKLSADMRRPKKLEEPEPCAKIYQHALPLHKKIPENIGSKSYVPNRICQSKHSAFRDNNHCSGRKTDRDPVSNSTNLSVGASKKTRSLFSADAKANFKVIKTAAAMR